METDQWRKLGVEASKERKRVQRYHCCTHDASTVLASSPSASLSAVAGHGQRSPPPYHSHRDAMTTNPCCSDPSSSANSNHLVLLFFSSGTTSQQFFSFTPLQQQPPATSLPVLFFSHTTPAPAQRTERVYVPWQKPKWQRQRPKENEKTLFFEKQK